MNITIYTCFEGPADGTQVELPTELVKGADTVLVPYGDFVRAWAGDPWHRELAVYRVNAVARTLLWVGDDL